ncbi:uncharacterized protein LOC144440313 [Glandiceps talaboti]
MSLKLVNCVHRFLLLTICTTLITSDTNSVVTSSNPVTPKVLRGEIGKLLSVEFLIDIPYLFHNNGYADMVLWQTTPNRERRVRLLLVESDAGEVKVQQYGGYSLAYHSNPEFRLNVNFTIAKLDLSDVGDYDFRILTGTTSAESYEIHSYFTIMVKEDIDRGESVPLVIRTPYKKKNGVGFRKQAIVNNVSEPMVRTSTSPMNSTVQTTDEQGSKDPHKRRNGLKLTRVNVLVLWTTLLCLLVAISVILIIIIGRRHRREKTRYLTKHETIHRIPVKSLPNEYTIML